VKGADVALPTRTLLAKKSTRDTPSESDADAVSPTAAGWTILVPVAGAEIATVGPEFGDTGTVVTSRPKQFPYPVAIKAMLPGAFQVCVRVIGSPVMAYVVLVPSPKLKSNAPHWPTPATVTETDCPTRGDVGEKVTLSRLLTPMLTALVLERPYMSNAFARIVCQPAGTLDQVAAYGATVSDTMRAPFA
jgi:hypothetical protein